jgi:glycosyltransferase involved in cell wall biosynthesis
VIEPPAPGSITGVGPGPDEPGAPDALSQARLHAARERGRFERELDETRAMLERRTVALTRSQKNLARLQSRLDRVRSDPIVRTWLRGRGALARLARAPRRLPKIVARLRPSGGEARSAASGGPEASLVTDVAKDRLLVALVGRPDTRIEEAVRAAGWRAVDSGSVDQPDLAMAVHPTADVAAISREVLRVAWIRGDIGAWLAAPWLEDLDLVLVDNPTDGAAFEAVVGAPRVIEDASALPVAVAEHLIRPRLAIQIGPPTWEAAGHWGDTSFARALERAFRRRGWATSVLVDAERDGPVARRADVALHVVGVRQPPLHPGQTHLLWIISHPDAVRPEQCDAYDLVFVASEEFAQELRLRVSVPVVALHQATDPRRFFPEAGGPAHELLFVGNSRNRRRPVLDALSDSPWKLAVYGTGWRAELLDPRHLHGEWVRNEELHRYYSAATIVLNDHWADMRDEGFISNRIYDALASGAFVLSDDVPGIAAEFDDGLVTWADPQSLRAAVARYLADTAARRAIVARGRQAVLQRHTFDHRVATILDTLDSIKGAAPGAAGPIAR